jgi:signal transduction histidine kinase
VAAHPGVADAGTAALLVALGLLAVRVGIDTAPTGYRPPATPVWVALTVALVGPLAWRRSHPLAVLTAITVVFFPYRLVDVPDLTVSVVVWWLALYSAGAYGRGWWRTPARVVNVAAALGFLTWRLLAVAEGPDLLRAVFLVLFNVAFVTAAWTFGDVVAERRAHEAALVERAVQLEREREERARRAVFDERVRIARELHDVVAHHVSVMGVQAGAARRVMDRRPDEAVRALASIEQTSRQAIGELHRVLGFLRREGEPDDLAPQPRLDQLDALVRDFSATGLGVRLVRDGSPGDLPGTVQVSAYRIVQEALTNAVRHSTAGEVVVQLVQEPHRLVVEICNDGQQVADPSPGGAGHGLIGMRERVALHRGEFQAGPLGGGGYRVRAAFPLEEVRA